MTAFKTSLFVLLLATASSTANADPINADSTGLSSPQSTLDFGTLLYADHTPVTDQFQGDGVTFSTNGDSWLYRTFTCSLVCLANGIEFGHLIGGGGSHTTFSIHFNGSVSEAAFIFKAFPKEWTLTSWLNGELVESFTFTAAGEGNSTVRIYGFENSVFDTLSFARTQPDTSGFEFDNFQFSFLNAVDLISDLVQDIIDIDPDAPPVDKLENAIVILLTALDEFNKTLPDNQAGVGNLEGAVGEIEAAINEGFDPDQGRELMDQLAGIARQVATDALDEAIARGADPSVVADAEQSLFDGDFLRLSLFFKEAVNKYKDALAKAESG